MRPSCGQLIVRGGGFSARGRQARTGTPRKPQLRYHGPTVDEPRISWIAPSDSRGSSWPGRQVAAESSRDSPGGASRDKDRRYTSTKPLPKGTDHDEPEHPSGDSQGKPRVGGTERAGHTGMGAAGSRPRRDRRAFRSEERRVG